MSIETLVSRAGGVTPDLAADLKRSGFAAVINLRLADEADADVAAENRAVTRAGLTFVHLPLRPDAPDAAVADAFLIALANPAHQPAFIHCRSGNRAAALWSIKRMQMDGWSAASAMDEAARLGLTSATLTQFALDYVRAHAPLVSSRRNV